MKKNILFVGALLCATVFSGCTVTSEVTTYGLFESTIKEVTQDLEKEGFNLVESNKDVSHNPGIVRGKLDKFNGEEHVYVNTYRFANDEGETMSYSVNYRTSTDPSTMTTFVREVYTEGCETSSSKHKERLCGESSPIHKLDNLPKNTTVRH